MQNFISSIYQSFAIIFLSEIADRTFILILIFAAKLNWLPLLITSCLALGTMNILAIAVGYLVPMLVVKSIVNWIGFACFLSFGLYSIYDSFHMESETVADKLSEYKKDDDLNYKDIETNNESRKERGVFQVCLELFIALTLSEMGDKSQITTVAIAALYNIYGVLIGTCLAYFCTILIAIICGHFLSKYVSEKQMTLIGGIIFLIFAGQLLLVQLGVIAE